MMYYKSSSFLIMILTSFLFSTINALTVENIISPYPPEPLNFTYQVAIIAKKNFSTHSSLFCGGGIIAEKFILTAAQCFITESGYHREFTYSIVANKTNLNSKGGIEISIYLIYLPRKGSFQDNDISVAELEKELGIANSPHLSKLNIADADESFVGQIGIVAGHGYNKVELRYDYEQKKIVRAAGSTDELLRYLEVRILNKFLSHRLDPTNPYRKVCGMSWTGNRYFGFCDLDTGSPLVINDTVAAVANSPKPTCNDYLICGMYTNVSVYALFINAIMSGNPLANTIIYRNRQHVLSENGYWMV